MGRTTGDIAWIERVCDLLLELQEEDRMDVTFNAIVRCDVVARHPDVMKKMIKANIARFCMGIESSKPDDFKKPKRVH